MSERHGVGTAGALVGGLLLAVAWAGGPARAESPAPEEGACGGAEAPDDVAEADPARTHDPARYGPFFLPSGIALPYPLDNVFRGFADCHRGRHRHPALDIGGVGPDWGLGTPVRAMVRARVTAIGTPELDPERWGHRLDDAPSTRRGRSELPTSGVHPGYGQVWYFTRDYGRSRTGVFVATVGLGGRLDRHTITYMHLAALHPEVTVGTIVEAGQELGLMGGTAVQESPPHLHIAVKNRAGRALDVGPLLGIGPTRASCRRGKAGERALRARYSANAVRLMASLRRERARTPEVAAAPPCGDWTYEGEVSGPRVSGHRIALPAPDVPAAGGAPWQLRVERLAGRWQPRLTLEGGARSLKVARRVSGRRGAMAEVTLRPGAGAGAGVLIGAWGSRGLPDGARYRLSLSRPCAAPP